MKRNMKKWLAGMLAGALALTLTACGGGTQGEDTIVIYDGQFAEMQIIHRMVKLLVEEHTDAKVNIKDEMAPPASYSEIVRGNADLMNSYDGTLLTTFLHLDPSDVPDDMTLYDYANQEAAAEGVRLLGKLGLNNTYQVAVPQAIADEYNLKTISDLAAVSDQLVFAAEHDFFTEEGSAKYIPLTEFYGLQFKEAKQIDINLKYSAVQNGNMDVTVVYATDGLNKEAQLVLLEDDRNFFPEYNGALLVRTDLFDRMQDAAPNLEEVLEMLTGRLTTDVMIDLSYQVDVGVDGVKKSVDEVAKTFLQENGLIAS
ncbi:MAG: glycine/betaine ABC transporter substrate-binding protein [Oscillospiraceae bacterium]|nr:glycine/betaine ABC transporter substrate-binding protein [Oscillospiraceae bacterium]